MPDEQRFADLLASLADAQATPPPADDAYWQARVRLALEDERARRASVLRPLRTLHLVLGFAALAVAVVLVPFSPELGVFAAPSIFAAVTLAALAFSEATLDRIASAGTAP